MSSSTSERRMSLSRTLARLRAALRRMFSSPFFYALLPSLLFYTVIFSRNWIPIHDTFQVTNMTYFIFNEIATHRAIPLWYPYINYGLDANWYLNFTIGPSLATMMPVAWLLGRGDFLHYYYASMLLDETILLTGTYLLARTLFQSRWTAGFVCIAMTGSTLWFAQPWFNFHMYYFVPLASYFAVTGAMRGQLWRILAGGLALLVSEFGNLPYFPVIHGLTYASIVAGAWWAYRLNVRAALRRAGRMEYLVLAGCALTAGLYLLLLVYGVNHINYDVGRTGAVVNAENFLTYGGAVGLRKFAELFTGTSWDIDANGYAGVLVVVCALFGLVWAPERRMAPFLGTAIFFTLLSVGPDSFIAPLVYQLPGAAYYRHIGLVLPLIKVMLIVLAGFGFDALLDTVRRADDLGRTRVLAAYGTFAAILVLTLTLAALLTAAGALSMKYFHHQYVFSELNELSSGFGHHIMMFLSRAAFVGLVYVAAVGIVAAAAMRARVLPAALGVALVLLQAIDVYSYRISQFEDHMVPIDAAYRQLFAFGERPYAEQRTRNPMRSFAFRIVASGFSQPIERQWYDVCTASSAIHCYYNFRDTREGVYYDTVEPFAGLDPCRSIFRIDYWLPGVDLFYRAVTDLPLHDLSALPAGYETGTIYFPINNVPLDKAIGCGFPKLQLFSSVAVMQNEDAMAALIRDPKYRGDLLLTTASDYAAYLRRQHAAAVLSPDEVLPEVRPTAAARVPGRVRILNVTANTVVVQATPASTAGPYWLYFADAWHPFWHAYVNGVETPVLRANFGFKAVRIPSGSATITFVYRSALLTAALTVAIALLLFTMLGIGLTAVRLMLGET
jgi:hypothetical protein